MSLLRSTCRSRDCECWTLVALMVSFPLKKLSGAARYVALSRCRRRTGQQSQHSIGILLRDLQKQVSPSAELVGVDVMPSFLPKDNSSGNIRYALQDVCEPFAPNLTGAFDLTHVRYVLVGAGRVGIDAAVRNLAGSLAPGGWLQIQELDLASDAATTPAMQDFKVVFQSLLGKVGIEPSFAGSLSDVLKDAGLQNIQSKRIQYPLGKNMGNALDSRDSIEPFKLTIPTIVATVASGFPLLRTPNRSSMALTNQSSPGLGISLPASLTTNLAERFEQEMMTGGGMFEGYIVWGQKPSV